MKQLVVFVIVLNLYLVCGLQHAICELSGQGTDINGRVDFYGLCNGDTNVIISASGTGLTQGKSYAVQIEEYAEQNKNFNPLKRPHGCPGNDTDISVGDLGNLVVTQYSLGISSGQSFFVVPSAVGMTLVGPNSIVGRYVRLYSVSDDCIDFPQTSIILPQVLAECTLGISNEITFSEANVENDNISAAYCAFNSSGLNAIIDIDKVNSAIQFTATINGLNAIHNYTFSIHLYGDLIDGVGPIYDDGFSIEEQANNLGNIQVTTNAPSVNFTNIIGRSVVLTDMLNNVLGNCVIGVNNVTIISPKPSSSKMSSHTSKNNDMSSKPSSGSTVVWVAVGASAAVLCLSVFGTIIYIKVKNTGKNIYL